MFVETGYDGDGDGDDVDDEERTDGFEYLAQSFPAISTSFIVLLTDTIDHRPDHRCYHDAYDEAARSRCRPWVVHHSCGSRLIAVTVLPADQGNAGEHGGECGNR